MKAFKLARLLDAGPNQSVLFTNGSGTIYRIAAGPYLEDDDGAVWIDLMPVENKHGLG